MKKLTWTWKKITALIAGLLGIGTLVSCYGTLNNEALEASICGYVYGDINKDGELEPVPGIRITSIGHDYTALSDEKGYFVFWVSKETTSCTLDFYDSDGETNGSFKSGSVYVRSLKENVSVKLQPVEEEPLPDTDPID